MESAVSPAPAPFGARAKEAAIAVARTLPFAGIDPLRFGRAVRSAPGFVRDYRNYRRMLVERGQPVPKFIDTFPILGDQGDESGAASGHYFHQDIWAARKVYEAKPVHHYDIGSRVDGFISSIVVFQPVTVLDVRRLETDVENLSFVQADATRLDGMADRSIDSISTLHAVEHFGLGRYGDPIDPDGWSRAIAELVRVAAPGGRVYFSTPVGRERTMFNAHRIFAPDTILRAFDELELVSFSAVNDAGDFVPNTDPASFADARYACGMFEFTRAS